MSDYVYTNPPTTDTPNGTFKNETQPNAADGTDINAERRDFVVYTYIFPIIFYLGKLYFLL